MRIVAGNNVEGRSQKMIRGLQIEIETAELKIRLCQKMKEYEAQADAYAKQREDLEKAGSGRTLEKNDLCHHEHGYRAKAVQLEFILDHLILHEVYVLGIDELRFMGLLRDHQG